MARILVIAVILGAGGAGVWYWRTQQSPNDVNQLVLYGNVDVRQVELAINGSDRIEQLLVEEGDRIEKGQLLAKLETERLDLAVQRAKAAVDSQRQVVARLESGSRPEEIAKARADLEVAQAVALDAKRTYERNLKLAKSNAIPQQEVDDSLAAYQAAEARIQALQAGLDLLIAGPRKEDIAEAKALVQGYEVELAQAEHDLKNACLYAPNNGIVQERILEVGDMASPQTPVFTVALIDPIWVRAYVSEPDLGKIREGMKAAVVTDSFPEKKCEAWIGFISPTAEFTPKPVETRELRTKLAYQVRVFVKNSNNELRMGMPATVKIRLDQEPTEEKSPQAESDTLIPEYDASPAGE